MYTCALPLRLQHRAAKEGFPAVQLILLHAIHL